MLSVINATYKNDYTMVIEFNDHKKGEVDLKPLIFEGNLTPFKKLADIEKFKKFHVDYTLKWNDGLDLAPEFLYFKAFEKEPSLHQQFVQWGYTK